MKESNVVDQLIKQINEYFSNPDNTEQIVDVINKSMQEPCFKQLQCVNYDCKYLLPKDLEMGVITYCSKYKCDEKCDSRIKMEMI